MAWTPTQDLAINKRGSNCIVSAGAGSGKTAVLSERILKYCLDGNDICSFLVLTFTNAAASEMKERIRKKLIDNNLFTQASRIDSAFITTFDAYSLALVKKYYFHLGIERDISIIDQALLVTQKQIILDKLFEEMYLNKDEKFFNLLRKYTKQNDDIIKTMILSFLDSLDLIVDEEDFLKNYNNNYLSESFISSLISKYEEYAYNEINSFIKELMKLQALACSDSASIKLYNEVTDIINSYKINNYEDTYVWINSIVLPRINPKACDDVKNKKTYCSDLLKEIKVKYFSKYSFIEDAKNEILSMKDDILYILELTKKLKDRIDDFKYSLMAFDYVDIAKMAIKLVKTKESVREEIKNSFTEILIDEYQDTSDIQETFISYIANNNCYMVGDIKQSIYRFRNANPYIFKNKYNKYASNCDGIKIDLTHNFRSCSDVVNNINLFFSNLMTLKYGDADYLKEHMMRYGQVDYEACPIKEDHNMEILNYDPLDDFSDEETEAFICGRKIIELINGNHLVLKGKNFEKLKYSDIAILIDKSKSFVTFKKIFEYLGIPLSIEADLDLNDSILPKLFSNIFSCIVNKYYNIYDKNYEHCLASIGRSFLFEFDDLKIYKMIKFKEKNELTDLIFSLSKKLEEISLEEIYYNIIDNFNIYEKLSIIGDVNNSIIVLEYIANIFKTMANSGMNALDASEYFASIFKNGISLKYKMNEDSKNCVRIMTIHKSKGLEFPYCFFPMLSSKFNKADIRKNHGISTKYGLYMPYSDETNSNTIIKTLVDEEISEADLSEKIRLFYVALTRAREKIFIISKNIIETDNIDINKVSSFNDLLNVKNIFSEYKKNVDIDKLNISLDYKKTKKNINVLNKSDIEYENLDLNKETYNKTKISKELNDLISPELKRNIELGLKFHECLEVLDFNNPDVYSLEVDDFIKNKIIDILKTEVFMNIKNAKTYHEHEFYFENYHGIIDLLCIYDDHIDIIDYKLANTDSAEYVRQLSIYKSYVEANMNLKVNCYLLSILKAEVKKII